MSCFKIWDKGNYSEESGQNPARQVSVLGYAEAAVKIQGYFQKEKLL